MKTPVHAFSFLPLTGLTLALLSGCFVPAGGHHDDDVTHIPPPPPACTSTPVATTLCTGGGPCAIQSESVIGCDRAVSAAIGAGPAGTGVLALAMHGSEGPDYHAQFGVLDANGSGVFRVDPVPAGSSTSTSNPIAYLSATSDTNGTAVWVTTLGDQTVSVRDGTAGSEEIPDPLNNGVGDPAVAAVAFEPDGTEDVLVRNLSGIWLFQRAPDGRWTHQDIDGSSSLPMAMAVGSDGVRYIATAQVGANGDLDVTVAAGAGGGAFAGHVSHDTVSLTVLAARTSSSPSVPVVLARGGELALLVGDGAGGFSQMAYSPPGAGIQDSCPHVATVGDCSCPSACARTGQAPLDATLVRDADGSALLATVVADVDQRFSVTRNSTESSLGTLTCSCDATLQGGSVQASRIVLTAVRAGASPAFRERGTLGAASSTSAVAGVERDGLDQLLLSEGSGSTLRRVVLDPSRL